MSGRVRVIGASDIGVVRAFLEQDPVANIFFLSRLELAGNRAAGLGHPLYGFWRDHELVSVCHPGYNLVVAGDDDEAIAAFAQRIGRYRSTSSIMGSAEIVPKLYRQLIDRWGNRWAKPREIRAHQPLLAITEEPAVAPDPEVREIALGEYEPYLEAAIKMYTEEVGVSPIVGSGSGYRNYVRWMILDRRAFGVVKDGKVWFKSDIAVVYQDICQIQGVWIDPALRGRGMSEAAMAQVVKLCLKEFRVVSLYVNDFNIRARKLYQRVGFKQVGELATVLY